MTPAILLRRAGAACLLALGLLVGALAASVGAASTAPERPRVEIVEIDGLVDRAVAGHIVDALADAAAGGADVAVLQLHSAGALRADVAGLVDAIVASDVPVAVWLGPPGSQATGGAFLVAQAAHVLGMAPATSMGAALPVDLADGRTLDAEALAVQLAELRGRDAEFARAAVTQGRVVVATNGRTLPQDAVLPRGIAREDVVDLGPREIVAAGLVEFTAVSLPDALAALEGREVVLADGRTVTLGGYAERADVRFNNLGLVERTLHTVASPTLAYLLIVGGALAIAFEVFQPGFGVAGVTGAGLLALGTYGVSVLPVSWPAYAALLAGIAVLGIDLALARLGLLSAVGTALVAAGSVFLLGGPLDLAGWLVGLVVVAVAVFFVAVMTVVLRAQGNQALADTAALVGKVGVVRSVLNPEGHIFVDGALWRARAPEHAGKVTTGTRVRVVGLNDRLTLDVEVVEERASAAG